METISKILFVLTLIVWGAAIFVLGMNMDSMIVFKNTLTKTDVSNYSQCTNLSLEKTANCLRDYVSGFYNYTIRDDVSRSLEDIKKNGGDCYDYANLYASMGQSLGFYTNTLTMDILNDTQHKIATISNSEGYCVLDQLFTNCQLVKVDVVYQ